MTPFEKAASGALASAIANTLVYPLDLSKTLVQTQAKKHRHSSPQTPPSDSDMDESIYKQKYNAKNELKYKNTLDVLKKIYAKKGVLGWYHGLFSSIFGTAVQNFAYFYWYTIVKRVYHQIYKTAKPTTAMELFLGALAAAISQMFTMPIGVLTTQQQTSKEHKSLIQLTRDIIEHDGIPGLWKGLKVSLVLCINPSITYGSYERLRQIFFPNKEYLGPMDSFSLGVLAKSMATVTTQPLIVSKAMLQKKKHIKKQGEKASDNDEEDDDVHFDSFPEALAHLWKTEQFKGLYKGIAPQLLKGVFVQGLLFMFKDQIDAQFVKFLNGLKKKK
jgi:hypothetical protein